jgi:hypothetical protein
MNDKKKLTANEIGILEGLKLLYDVDICTPFPCSRDGCEFCPLNKLVKAQENFVAELDNLIAENQED